MKDRTFKVVFNSSNRNFDNINFNPSSFPSTKDYEELLNKPKIEGHELIKDKTFKELGLDTLSIQDIEKIFYLG